MARGFAAISSLAQTGVLERYCGLLTDPLTVEFNIDISDVFKQMRRYFFVELERHDHFRWLESRFLCQCPMSMVPWVSFNDNKRPESDIVMVLASLVAVDRSFSAAKLKRYFSSRR